MDRVLNPSLVARTAAGSGLAVVVLLGVCSLVLYLSLSRLFRLEGASQLQQATKRVVERLEVDHEPPHQELLEGEERVFLRVTDRAGRILVESEGMSRMIPPDQLPVPGGWTWMELEGAKDAHFQVLAVQLQGGWVLAARDLRPDAWLLGSFGRILVITWIATTLASALVVAWLTHRGLRPLASLAEQAAAIRSDHLSMRLNAKAFPSELGVVARTLNRSLGSLEEAFARLTALNADMAHELRTPLHAIRLEVEELLEHGELQGKHRDTLASLLEEVDHLKITLDQLLFLARSEDPATAIHMVRQEVAELFEASTGPFECLAEEKEIRLDVEAPEGLALWADPTLARRALHNLLANAIRHAPAGSVIALRGRGEGALLVLQVEDQGEGIPGEFLARIGQRFLRTDSSRTRATGGSGLGLAIVHSIMRLHGGALDIHSEMERGTTVRLCFPMR